MQIFILILFIIFLSFAYASLKGAPWVPTWKGDVERFIDLANIKQGQKMYDLGCGDGRLICAAGKKGADAVGFEISLLPYFITKLRILLGDNKNVKIKYQDIWHVDLSDADIVYFFLSAKACSQLRKKFEKELKKGCKVITYTWPIKEWKPTKVDIQEGKPKLYLYQIK